MNVLYGQNLFPALGYILINRSIANKGVQDDEKQKIEKCFHLLQLLYNYITQTFFFYLKKYLN